MLADSLTKIGYPARATIELFMKRRQLWRAVHDEKYESQKRRTKKGLDRLVEQPTSNEDDRDTSLRKREDRDMRDDERVDAYQSGGDMVMVITDIVSADDGLPSTSNELLRTKNRDRAMSSLPMAVKK